MNKIYLLAAITSSLSFAGDAVAAQNGQGQPSAPSSTNAARVATAPIAAMPDNIKYYCHLDNANSCFSNVPACVKETGGPCVMYQAITAPMPSGSQKEIERQLSAIKPSPVYVPNQRKWASPAKKCTSQDGTQSGYVSVGPPGGNRCEYFIAKPVPKEISAQQ